MIFITGGIDDPEIEPEQVRVALSPVTGDAGQVIDQRQLLADQAVEQRRFADIGSADDRDDGKLSHECLLACADAHASRFDMCRDQR